MLLLLALACPTPVLDDSAAVPEGTPTWNQDIAPLVEERCAGCHAPGEIGPFSLTDFASAAPMASAMSAAVDADRMPPWGARATDECTPRYGWKNDLTFSEEEKALLRAWAEAGAPEGDPETAAEIPPTVSLTLEGANQHLEPRVGFAASGNQDQYTCFVMDPELAQEAWITGVQVVAGNRAVVHHALIFADRSGSAAALANADGYYNCPANEGLGGDLIGAWAPGAVPNETPEGVGITVAAGSMIVMQIHYHPLGEVADVDVTGVDIRWQDTKPEHPAVLALVGNANSEGDGLLPGPNDDAGVEFRIPAGATGHTETMEFKIRDAQVKYQVFMAGTHMHYVGTDMAIWVDHKKPEGDETESECLVQTPAWDFDWQRGYDYDTPLETVPQVRTGDTIRMRCTYDNTLANPGVARALSDAGLAEPADVYMGETTLDEMCLGVFGIVYE
ncbi:hypothetical protein LBMAG42_23660 [Deltaproteobacteria bacterium]|nr:hypothetical protein LBMAG42_23660 [Deltaproteobacteria bacterium]